MKDLEALTFAVVGATGTIGRHLVESLDARTIPIKRLRLLASERSEGLPMQFRGEELEVEKLTPEALKNVDLVFLAATSAVNAEYRSLAVESGAVVVWCSDHSTREDDIALVVPEVNAHAVSELLKEKSGRGVVIANPAPSTVQLVVILNPILKEAGLERVVVSTYQSTSGAGQKGIDELWNQTLATFAQEELESSVFPHAVAFNVVPQTDSLLENGYSAEEVRVVRESRRVLGKDDLRLSITTVYVPTFSGDCQSVNVETSKPLSPAQARELLSVSPGVLVLDDPQTNHYPLPASIANPSVTHVGRIRRDESVEHGLNLWIVADNLRKGSALNAVQIAELIVDYWKKSASAETIS